MTPPLETPRLLLTPLTLADAEQAQALFPHWEIVKYLSAVPWPYPPNGAYTFFRDRALPAMARGEAWHWILRLRIAPERMIGSICLTTAEPNRGFWLAPEFRRQGLMTEACRAVNDFWFEVLGFPVLRTNKALVNAASRRISDQEGMRVIGTEERNFVAGRLPAEILEMTAEEWAAKKSAQNVDPARSDSSSGRSQDEHGSK